MVKPATIAYGVIGAAALAGGFALDRAMADMPSRVEGRVPDIARPRENSDDYYSDTPPHARGWFVNPAIIWGSALLGAAGVAAAFTARSTVSLDRVWHATPIGRGAIGAAVAGVALMSGASASRLALG